MSGASLATKGAVDPLIHKDYLEELAHAYLPKTPIVRTRASPRFIPGCGAFRPRSFRSVPTKR